MCSKSDANSVVSLHLMPLISVNLIQCELLLLSCVNLSVLSVQKLWGGGGGGKFCRLEYVMNF